MADLTLYSARACPFAHRTRLVLAHKAIDGLIREAHRRAEGLLAEHRSLLEALAAALLDEETLDAGRIRELAERFDAIPAPRAPHPLMPAPRTELSRPA